LRFSSQAADTNIGNSVIYVLQISFKNTFSFARFAQKIYRTEESAARLDVTVYRGLDKSGLQRVGPNQGSVSNYCSVLTVI